MRKLLLCGSRNNTITPLVFRLRDGMKPMLIGEPTGQFTVNNQANPNYAISPDGQKAVVTNAGAGVGSFLYSTAAPTEAHIFPSGSTTTASFSGSVSCVGSSDTHFAVGGTSPFLYVFDWATKTLQTTNNTGLGTVIKVKFSPDGSKLAVLHITTPYLRIYNTADWTFINAGTASGYPGNVNDADLFFTDDGRLVTGTNSSPYLCTYDVATGARLNAITATATNNSVISLVKHPDQNALIWMGNTASGRRSGLYNLSTYAVSNPFVDPAAVVTSCVLDSVNRELILIHNALSGRYCSIISLDAPTVLVDPGEHLASQIQSSGFKLVVVERDIGKITGTVRDIDNNPAARRVMAFNRDGGYLSASTMSDASTGNYELYVENTGLHDVQFRIADGELLNDLFFARVEPEAV